jgi:polyhydroxybutyrate depolymerase
MKSRRPKSSRTILRSRPNVAALLASAVAVVLSMLSAVPPAGAQSLVGAPAQDTSVTSSTSNGCGTSVTPGSSTLSLEVGGHARTVIVHIPSGYTGTQKVPLVLNMHGSGSTAAEQEGLTGMDAESDAAGFIVAYPQALIPSGTGFDWNIPGVPLRTGADAPKHPANDMAFLSQLPRLLEQRLCVDSRRVYATGFSGGARITSQLACDDSRVFAAVAPVSGLRRPTPCPIARRVPVLAFHGTADPVDPYDGHGQAYWTYSVPQAARDWGAEDGCRKRSVTTTPTVGLTLTSYVGCKGGSVVELYSLVGEGHEWPGGPHLRKALTRVLGPQSDAVNADAAMWAFFSAHELP